MLKLSALFGEEPSISLKVMWFCSISLCYSCYFHENSQSIHSVIIVRLGNQSRSQLSKGSGPPGWVGMAATTKDEENAYRVPKCDVTKILFLGYCNFGLRF